MTTAALELALALHRAPVQRERLRAMRLPADVGAVIAIAAGSQPLSKDAALRLGEAEDTLRDACRFYVEQVLLEPGTDPYRVLGVARDAGVERIRQHYHWLQRWLHPDRTDGWESVFAARVNWAWQHLRSERSRQAWDSAHPAVMEPRIPEGRLGPNAIQLDARWFAIPAADGALADRQWHRPWMAVLVAACVVLAAVLALRHLHASGMTGATIPTRLAHGTLRSAARPPAAVVTPTHRVPAVAVGSAAPAAPRRTATVGRAELPRKSRLVASTSPPHVHAKPTTQPARRGKQVARTTAAPARAAVASVRQGAPPGRPAAAARQGAPAQAATGIPATQLVARVERARTRLQDILAYFRSRDGRVAGAHDPAAIAKYQLALLLQRNRLPAAPRFALEHPFWRADAESASVRADYSVDARRAKAERGVFDLQMAWQRGDWRITHLALEPR